MRRPRRSWWLSYLLTTRRASSKRSAGAIPGSFARFVARDWVAAIIPARFKKYDEAIARRAFATVFVLRLVFWMPPLLHALFGVSKVRFSTHFWGSLAGYLLPVFLVSFFGQKLFDLLKDAPAGVWIALGVAAALIGAALWLVRRRALRARRAGSDRSGLVPEQ